MIGNDREREREIRKGWEMTLGWNQTTGVQRFWYGGLCQPRHSTFQKSWTSRKWTKLYHQHSDGPGQLVWAQRAWHILLFTLGQQAVAYDEPCIDASQHQYYRRWLALGGGVGWWWGWGTTSRFKDFRCLFMTDVTGKNIDASVSQKTFTKRKQNVSVSQQLATIYILSQQTKKF